MSVWSKTLEVVKVKIPDEAAVKLATVTATRCEADYVFKLKPALRHLSRGPQEKREGSVDPEQL